MGRRPVCALADCRVTFFVIGLIAVAATSVCLRLGTDAGAEVKRHDPSAVENGPKRRRRLQLWPQTSPR